MKKAIGILAALSICLLASTAFAEDTTTVKGFYDIGTVQNVTVTPKSNDGAVTSSSVDVDNDQTAETFFEGADRLDVTYAAADEGSYYGAILVEGTGRPTEDNTIFYIDQVTAESGSVNFNVFPKEPAQTTALTLYISSNAEGHDLISVPLNYAVATISNDSGSGEGGEGGGTVTPPGGEGGEGGAVTPPGGDGEGGGTVNPPAGDDDDDEDDDDADTTTASGFYNIGTKENVTTTVKGETGVITSISQDVNADETADTFFPASDRIEVTYSAATSGSYYGVVLSNGRTVPTKSSDIFYINQVTASGTSVTFNVYPMLPTATTDMTLFISSNAQGHTLVSVPLSYAKDVTITAPSTPQYTLGDVDDNGKVEIEDAVMTLQIIAQLHQPTETERLAANVDGNATVEIEDAVMILQYIAQIISSWN